MTQCSLCKNQDVADVITSGNVTLQWPMWPCEIDSFQSSSLLGFTKGVSTEHQLTRLLALLLLVRNVVLRHQMSILAIRRWLPTLVNHPPSCCCSHLTAQLVSKMSALSILLSSCWLKNSGSRRDSIYFMVLFTGFLLSFYSRDFLSCRRKKDIINKRILEWAKRKTASHYSYFFFRLNLSLPCGWSSCDAVTLGAIVDLCAAVVSVESDFCWGRPSYL